MRPGGEISSTQPPSSQGHDTVGTQGASPPSPSGPVRVRSQTSQREPTMVWSATVRANCSPWARRGVRRTHSRSAGWPMARRSSSRDAMAPNRG